MIESRNTLPRIALCMLLALGACSGGDDGTGPDGDVQGSFTATLSGPVSTSLSGYAWQSGTIVDPQTNTRGWVLFLGTDAGTGSAVYIPGFLRRRGQLKRFAEGGPIHGSRTTWSMTVSRFVSAADRVAPVRPATC